MKNSISKIYYVGIISTLIFILFFAPTTGGPCNAGLDLFFVLVILIMTGIPSLIAIKMLNRGKSKDKNIIVFLSGCSFVLWGLISFNLIGENTMLTIFMIPLLIIYLLIMVTGAKIQNS